MMVPNAFEANGTNDQKYDVEKNTATSTGHPAGQVVDKFPVAR